LAVFECRRDVTPLLRSLLQTPLTHIDKAVLYPSRYINLFFVIIVLLSGNLFFARQSFSDGSAVCPHVLEKPTRHNKFFPLLLRPPLFRAYSLYRDGHCNEAVHVLKSFLTGILKDKEHETALFLLGGYNNNLSDTKPEVMV
jgi:hypothetical protein